MSNCSVEGCLLKSRARGMCISHYYHLWSKPLNKAHAKALRRRPHLFKFTPELWWSWWEDRRPDKRTVALREGIQMLRHTLP